VKFAHPQWRGFERAPEGHLLDQLVDLSGPMGIAYERSVGFHKDFHVHDRAMIILPRGACVVRVTTAGRRGDTYTFGNRSALIVPSGVEHEDDAVSSIFDTLALYPSTSLLATVANDEDVPPATATRFFSRCQVLARSQWLEGLVQEYVLARVVTGHESKKTIAFLERQILVELLAPAHDRRRRPERAVVPEAAGVADRALRHIEANLFSKLTLDAIAAHAFASPATVLRHFREAIGTTPHAYIRGRRLEEARRLIEAGHQRVSDVAMLVGYENFGAFSTSFKRYFGKPPSSYAPPPRR
jgi:AraC-like DNA-binding protein